MYHIPYLFKQSTMGKPRFKKSHEVKLPLFEVIEHLNLVDVNGFLDPNLGRFKRGLPNINDQIHLGINGIKRFVLNIKNKIMHNNP